MPPFQSLLVGRLYRKVTLSRKVHIGEKVGVAGGVAHLGEHARQFALMLHAMQDHMLLPMQRDEHRFAIPI